MAKLLDKEDARKKFKDELSKLDPEDLTAIRDILGEVIPPPAPEPEKGILETFFPFMGKGKE